VVVSFRTTEPLRYASLSQWHGPLADVISLMFDQAVTTGDLAWLRGLWHGPLIIKGIQNPADARLVVDHGAVVVSTHSGRQLDRALAPPELLPAVLDATGDDAEVYLDNGILSGRRHRRSPGAGACGCLTGRAFLYGLMAGGERGVPRASAARR
jgi:L-lactate dehydrogenase (cytochrome)